MNTLCRAFRLWMFALVCLAGPACSEALANGLFFTNALETPVEGVFIASPGNAPAQVAGPVASGQKAALDRQALQAGSRLIVRRTERLSLQFFSLAYFDSSLSLSLEQRAVNKGGANDFPQLLVSQSGERTEAIPAGLPFRLLQGDMETDRLTETRWAEWMNPLGLTNPAPESFAVNLADASWSIPPESVKFASGNDKKESRLSSIVLSGPASGEILSALLEEFQSFGLTPQLLIAVPHKPLAFGKEAFSLEAKARSHASMNKDVSVRWDAFRQDLRALERKGLPKGSPGLRLVFFSDRLCYELRMPTGKAESIISIGRR